jgi:hypothetical protein
MTVVTVTGATPRALSAFYDGLVRRTVVPRMNGAGSWEGLVLDVELPQRPGLVMLAAGRGHLLLRQDGADVLLARVQPDRYGVDYVRTDVFESPIPPLRAEEARDLGARKGRWAQRFADALAGNARGPLHAGRWALTHERPRRDDMVLTERNGEIDWFRHNGSWQILPLRGLSDPSAGRVKSYRKQVRDGVLPPVLLWWVSGLDLYVVLDGHDRLVAALAENQEPPLLALSRVDTQVVRQHSDAAVSRYATAAEAIQRQADHRVPGAAEASSSLARRLADTLRSIETARGATRAWPLPGGTAAWQTAARRHAPDL